LLSQQTQTLYPPLDEMAQVEKYYQWAKTSLQWSEVGILTDEAAGMQQSVLIVLIEQAQIVAVFRVCLASSAQTLVAVRLFIQASVADITLRVCQGTFFTQRDIQCLTAVNRLWQSASEQSHKFAAPSQQQLFDKLFSSERDKGRGKSFEYK
jgi:hypothetical protein